MNALRIRLAVAAAALCWLVSPARAGLPSSPNTTYVARSTPVIKAQDLNDLQKYLAGVFMGTYSVKTLFVDGAGGNPVTQLPGLVVATGKVTHTSLPAPVGYIPGTVSSGTVPLAWAVVNGDATFARGYKVYSVGRTAGGAANGDYMVVFDTSPADTTNVCPWATLISPNILAVGARLIQVVPGVSGGRQTLRVIVVNLAAAYVDSKFSTGVFGE